MSSIRDLKLSPMADQDLEDIRDYTLKQYGRDMADAYDVLIKQAFRDLCADPERFGSNDSSEYAPDLRRYHIQMSRMNAPYFIKNPRHIVFYFTSDDTNLIVARVLHDARDHANLI